MPCLPDEEVGAGGEREDEEEGLSPRAAEIKHGMDKGKDYDGFTPHGPKSGEHTQWSPETDGTVAPVGGLKRWSGTSAP